MNTRGLTGMTTNRIAEEDCTLVYLTKALQDDGSHKVVPVPFETKGSVVPLPPKEIQRLQEGGVVIRNGVSIALTVAPSDRPDHITVGTQKWRILSWAFVKEFDTVDMYPRGSVVAMCDEILTGSAS